MIIKTEKNNNQNNGGYNSAVDRQGAHRVNDEKLEKVAAYATIAGTSMALILGLSGMIKTALDARASGYGSMERDDAEKWWAKLIEQLKGVPTGPLCAETLTPIYEPIRDLNTASEPVVVGHISDIRSKPPVTPNVEEMISPFDAALTPLLLDGKSIEALLDGMSIDRR